MMFLSILKILSFNGVLLGVLFIGMSDVIYAHNYYQEDWPKQVGMVYAAAL